MILEFTASYWQSTNPTPTYQAMCIEEDTRRIKYGDSETEWNVLEYSGMISMGNSVLVDNTSTKGIVANPGGGQANATILRAKNNVVETVATPGDSVKAEPAIKNLEKVITNLSANDMDLFPSSGEYFQIGATPMAADAQLSIASMNSVKIVCYENGVWEII